MKSLDLIPTPPALRWREFRHRYLPVAVFACSVILTAMIWSRYASAPTLVGQVEAVRADVASQLPGRVSQLEVAEFSRVKAGDPVVRVITTDPKILESSLAVIKAEIELLQARSEPFLTRERNHLDFARIELDWLSQRVELASDRVQLQYAESEFSRVSRLYHQATNSNVVSKDQYEIALRDQRSLNAKVAERSKLVAGLEQQLQSFHYPPGGSTTNGYPNFLRATLDLQDQRLRLAEARLSPVLLRAPIDGTVSAVYRRDGETVSAGQPIVTITSPHSQRILSYVVPPIGTEPRVGMPVEVISRTLRREQARASVIEVAPHMDLVSPTLFSRVNGRTPDLQDRWPRTNYRSTEVGIPIAVNIPEGLHLRPGELVDLRLLPTPN